MSQANPQQQVAEAADSLGTSIDAFFDSLMTDVGLWKLAISLAVVVAAVVLRRLLLRWFDGQVDDPRTLYRWSKGSAYAVTLAVLLTLFIVWTGGRIGSIGTFLGLLTAGLAIALRDLIADFAGWIFILLRRPFDIGDRIQIGEHAGDVIDTRLFQFTIMEIGRWVDADQSTGRVIHIPNQKVFTEAQANYTAPFEYLWNEIGVLVTFESDWRRAKEILAEIAEELGGDVAEEARASLRRASRKFMIFYRKLTPVVYTSVKDSGIMLTIRYLCDPRRRRGSAEAIWEAILDRFGEEAAIDLAYPTQRLYYNQLEGKAGARAPLPAGLGAPDGAKGGGPGEPRSPGPEEPPEGAPPA